MEKKIFESEIGESYTLATLENGLKVYICEMPQFKSAYAIFGTKYGSIDTRFAKNGGEQITVPEGIAHFLEHKLFESEDGDAFTKYAETGASANAFTSFDRTCYLFSCSNNFEDNLDILLDFVQSPYFTKETVEKEQGIIGQEIRMYDDSPSWRVLFNMLSAMYVNHPVRIDIAGTVDSIAKIDYDLLYKCYETFYNPANMFICIAGDVDTRAVLKKIEGSVKNRGEVIIERGGFDEPDSINRKYIEQKLPVLTPVFCFGYKQKISSPFRRLKSKICVELLLEIICGDASPLYKRLMDKGLINDEFDFEYFTGRDYAAVIFSGESNNPRRVAQEIKKEIAYIKEHGFDKKHFSAVKCAAYGEAVKRFDSVQAVAMQLTECAVCDYDLFEQIKLLKTVSYDDVLKRTDVFDDNLSVLSVISPLEDEGK
ncbi:MAG: insulinase family protein [Clostridia bacterium]|nr:insulinase family protein [Clostridia bacterium]